MRREVELETTLVAKYVVMGPLLNERTRRLWAAAESIAIGFDGDAIVSSATGPARQTIRNGRRELRKARQRRTAFASRVRGVRSSSKRSPG